MYSLFLGVCANLLLLRYVNLPVRAKTGIDFERIVVMKKDFEILPHTADIKIKVYGKTLEELFCNAVIGMFQAIVPKIPGCITKHGRVVCDNFPERRTIHIETVDIEALLVDFLSEALYLSDVNDEAYLWVEISDLSHTKIDATLYGKKVDGFEVVEIKAVTYHEMEVKNVDGVWQTNIVFDI